MLYIKTELNSHVEIKVDFFADEVFTVCPVCGKEHQVDLETLKQLDDWSGTSITCGAAECNDSLSKKQNTLLITDERTNKKHLDDVFKFSIVKFTDKDEQISYRVLGYSDMGDEVEFGMRLTLEEAQELLKFYSQKSPDFQDIEA